MKKKCKYCGNTKMRTVEIPVKKVDGKMEYVLVEIFNCKCLENEKVKNDWGFRNQKINDLLKESRINKKFLDNDYKVYRPEFMPYYDNLDWIKEGKQLLICGWPGNHKTGQVTAIMKKAIKELLISVMYFRATEIPYQRQYEKIQSCKLLVIDNFGRDNFETSRGALWDIIDFRIHEYCATILITNGDKPELANIYDSPMMSRIKLFKMIGPIGKQGEDLRKAE